MSDSVISRRVRRLLAATAALPLSIVATTALTAQQQPAATTAPAPSDARLDAVLKKAPVIDGHNDLPWEMREKVSYDWDARDIAKPQPVMMTDIPRLRSGHVGGQFWSVYVPATLQGDAAVSATLEQVDAVFEMVRRYPNVFTLVRTADEMAAAMKAGRIGSLMGMEGGHSIASSLATLRMFRRLGVGYMTLTHSANVPWADSCTDVPKLQGLSKFGEEVVREMNRIGMLVDLSHVSPDTMADAIRVSQAPVIFSHSNAKAVADSPRNVPDEILRQVATNRGIVMVTFVPGFTSPEVAAYFRRATEQNKQFATQFPNDTAAQAAAFAEWRKSNPEPRATLTQVADHVDHIRKVAGIDHIGFGGDFDGITSVVQGLEDVGTYPALVKELMRRGYTESEVARITSGNILRVMREAEAVSAKLRAAPPSIKTIDKVDGITPRAQAVPPAR